MGKLQQSAVSNRLLVLLTDEDFDLLVDHLEAIELPVHMVLAERGKPTEFAYFPDYGIGSVIASSPEGQQVEAGLFGMEGFVPTGLLLHAGQSPHKIIMQLAGRGYRIRAAALIDAAGSSATLQALLLKYVHTTIVQIAFTALANAVHHIDERLARWLLMCHDRTLGNGIAVTHEFLSLMLAVRRPGVTTALHVLEGNHFIRNERGLITIRDRAGLETFAQDAYGQPEQEYERLVGHMH